jgi:hypothetical protein
VTLDEFFAGYETFRPLFDSLRALVESLSPVELRVTKSQVAFVQGRAFACAWIPERYLRRRGPPLVLSIALRRRDGSPRWKEVVEPAPGRFMHHLELRGATELDGEVRAWLEEARAEACAAARGRV